MAWVRCCGGTSTPVLPRPLTLTELQGNYTGGSSKTSVAFKVASTDIFVFKCWSNQNNTVIGIDISIDNGSTWSRVSSVTLVPAAQQQTFNVAIGTYVNKTVMIRISYTQQMAGHNLSVDSAIVQ